MITIKAYTDIEQSRKLAEILPIESADMWFANGIYLMKTSEEPKDIKGVFHCWSLAALISILPSEIKHDGIVYNLWITSEDVSYYSKEYDSYLYCEEGCTVDACYEMIIKLKRISVKNWRNKL